MGEYKIIDEPSPSAYEHLILPPILIFFVGMLLPLFWTPPFWGRIWGPFLWLIINGVLLGSPTIKYEIVMAVLGVAVWFGLPYAVAFVVFTFGDPNYWDFVVSYLRIAQQAFLFLAMYLIVFKQSSAHEIYTYLKEWG